MGRVNVIGGGELNERSGDDQYTRRGRRRRRHGGWKAVEVDHDMNDRWWLAGEARRKLVVYGGKERNVGFC
jgi:hypothetical protein